LGEANAPIPAGNLPDLVLGAFDAFGRDSEFAVQQQSVAEELAFPDWGHSALFAIDPEFEFLFQEPCDRRHHALSRRQ